MFRNFSIVALNTGTLQAFYQNSKTPNSWKIFASEKKMFLKVVTNSKKEAAFKIVKAT